MKCFETRDFLFGPGWESSLRHLEVLSRGNGVRFPKILAYRKIHELHHAFAEIIGRDRCLPHGVENSLKVSRLDRRDGPVTMFCPEPLELTTILLLGRRGDFSPTLTGIKPDDQIIESARHHLFLADYQLAEGFPRLVFLCEFNGADSGRAVSGSPARTPKSHPSFPVAIPEFARIFWQLAVYSRSSHPEPPGTKLLD